MKKEILRKKKGKQAGKKEDEWLKGKTRKQGKIGFQKGRFEDVIWK